MIDMNNPKVFQTRYTLSDCEKNQIKLTEILLDCITKNKPLGKEYSRKDWVNIINNAFMSQAIYQKVTFEFASGRIVDIGKNLHRFALDMFDEKRIKIDYNWYNKDKEIIDISMMWKILFNGAKDIFGYAVKEARDMSKEREIKEKPTSYIFSSDTEL